MRSSLKKTSRALLLLVFALVVSSSRDSAAQGSPTPEQTKRPLFCLNRPTGNLTVMADSNTCLCTNCPSDVTPVTYARGIAKSACESLGCKGTICVGDGGGRTKREKSDEACSLARAVVEGRLRSSNIPEPPPCGEGCTDCGVAVWESGKGTFFNVSCTVSHARHCSAGGICPPIPTATPTNTPTPGPDSPEPPSRPTGTPSPFPSPKL